MFTVGHAQCRTSPGPNRLGHRSLRGALILGRGARGSSSSRPGKASPGERHAVERTCATSYTRPSGRRHRRVGGCRRSPIREGGAAPGRQLPCYRPELSRAAHGDQDTAASADGSGRSRGSRKVAGGAPAAERGSVQPGRVGSGELKQGVSLSRGLRGSVVTRPVSPMHSPQPAGGRLRWPLARPCPGTKRHNPHALRVPSWCAGRRAHGLRCVLLQRGDLRLPVRVQPPPDGQRQGSRACLPWRTALCEPPRHFRALARRAKPRQTADRRARNGLGGGSGVTGVAERR